MASDWGPSSDHFFKILLRDLNPDMVAAWKDPEAFGDDKFTDLVEVRCVTYSSQLKAALALQISCGDIFDGAPAADAIVSVHLYSSPIRACIHRVH